VYTTDTNKRKGKGGEGRGGEGRGRERKGREGKGRKGEGRGGKGKRKEKLSEDLKRNEKNICI
jgi:hypothetical protein